MFELLNSIEVQKEETRKNICALSILHQFAINYILENQNYVCILLDVLRYAVDVHVHFI